MKFSTAHDISNRVVISATRMKLTKADDTKTMQEHALKGFHGEVSAAV